MWNVNKCGENRGNKNIKAKIPNTGYDRPKTTGEKIL
jgi:hypothetical protein